MKKFAAAALAVSLFALPVLGSAGSCNTCPAPKCKPACAPVCKPACAPACATPCLPSCLNPFTLVGGVINGVGSVVSGVGCAVGSIFNCGN